MSLEMILRFLNFFIHPFGIDFFCTNKKFLIFNLVIRNLKIKYKRSILGLLWTLINPLAMTAIYYFVFKVVMNIQVPFRLVFFMSGILFWNFIHQTIMEGMDSLVANVGLLTKVPIPIQVFPISGSLTNFFTLLTSIPILFITALISKVPISTSLVLLPLYMIIVLLVSYSISLILGIAFVFLRDLKHAIGILMSIWFYATPVVYSDEMIPAQYQWILYANPFGLFFVDLHTIWTAGRWPSPVNFMLSAAWCLFFLGLALVVYRKFSKGLVELL